MEKCGGGGVIMVGDVGDDERARWGWCVGFRRGGDVFGWSGKGVLPPASHSDRCSLPPVSGQFLTAKGLGFYSGITGRHRECEHRGLLARQKGGLFLS